MLTDIDADSQIWQKWLKWLPTAPPTDRPAPLFGHYRTELLQSGLDEMTADAQLVAIRRMMQTSPDGWQAMFNNIYTSPIPGFDTNPNALLVSAVAGRAPGRAVDLSAGQGRNAVFLATHGWDVTAVDISDEGLKIAARNAEHVSVHIQTVLQSIAAFDLGTAEWDLIIVTYAPVPLTSPEYATRLKASLRPGGLIVVETYALDPSGQRRTAIDLDPVELQRAMVGLRVLHCTDVVAVPDWDKDAARLIRFVAELP